MTPLRFLVTRYLFNVRQKIRGAARRIAEPATILPEKVDVSPDALATARTIRGGNHRPAIMLLGVLPRSGTRYVGQLLKLHPEVHAYPRGIVELPFINLAPHIRILQTRFFSGFAPEGTHGLGRDDFLPLFGASFISFAYREVGSAQCAMFGFPEVINLAYFPYLFPFEIPLLLIRDGRDLVESMVASWPAVSFPDACGRWNRSARLMLEQQKLHTDWRIFRYEDAVNDPRRFIEDVCAYCGLDPGRYPFGKIAQIPVLGSSQFKRDGEVSWDPVPKPGGFGPIGRWRRWTPRQKTIFKRVCGQTLLDTGYAGNLDW